MVRVPLRVDNVSQRKFFEILRSATFDFFTRSNGDFLKHLETEQKCRDQWNVSAWNQCSSGCGAPSVRRRHVTCKSSSCEGSKPKNLESCTRKCSYSWKKSPWARVLAKLTLICNFCATPLKKSTCSDRCGGHSTRQITCVGNNRSVSLTLKRALGLV